MLKPGGIIRIVVPHLEELVNDYIKRKENGEKETADKFLHALNMTKPMNRTFIEKVYDVMWNFHTHKWMYDKSSLYELLNNVGFRDLAISKPGVSRIKNIKEMNQDKYHNSIFIEGVK